MSRFKFRIWDKTRNGFVETGAYDCEFLLNHFGENDENDYVVQQWTGLKDSNGIDIYEGDIIEFQNISKKEMAKVYYNEDDSACGFYYPYILEFEYSAPIDNGTVIGNIFENRDLLKDIDN